MAQVIQPTALIVDADTQQRELIGTLLEEIGLEVIGVASSEGAVNMLRVNAYKIVLIVAAMNLPSFMDGVRLANYAQQWPWIRVVVTSYRQSPARATTWSVACQRCDPITHREGGFGKLPSD